MRNLYINPDEASNDVLACAAFLAERIESRDGHSDAVKEVIERYLRRGEVDLAAQMADAVEDFHARDSMLRAISLNCAVMNDDEYALQLAEAIEDPTDREVALENIAGEKARQQNFDKAMEIADSLGYRDGAYAQIALYRAAYGDDETAAALLDGLDPGMRAQVYSNVAKHKLGEDKPDEMAPYLTAAETATADVEMPEEKLRELAEIAGLWLQSGRKDRAIEVLSAARNLAETVESRDWRDYWLVQIAQFFFQADSRELAERALELIQDKYFFALCLRRFAELKRAAGETAEALEDLEEALALLVSQKSMEIRDSKARYELLSAVSGEIAACGKPERALETASRIEFDDARNRSFESIAVICASLENEPACQQALQAIEEDWIKADALIGISDVHRKNGETEKALQFLGEAHALSEEIPQLQMRSGALRAIAERYHALGDREKASAAMLEDLQIIERILDDYLRASTLLTAWDKYRPLEPAPSEKEKEVLNRMVTKILL